MWILAAIKLLSNPRKQHGEMRLAVIPEAVHSAVPVNKHPAPETFKQIFQTGICFLYRHCVEALDQIGIRYEHPSG